MQSLKRNLILSTALISVLAVSASRLSAAPKTQYSNHEELNEGDTPLTIAGKGINFLVSERGDFVGPGKARHMSFVNESQLIENNLKDCRHVVKSSAFLNHLNTFKQFESQHLAQFKKSLNRRPLSDTEDQAQPLIEKISLQLFKSSKHYLQNSKNRNDFEKDPELGGLFTFTLNSHQEVSVFVDDLSLCIPFFKGFKSDLGIDHLIPLGSAPNSQQRQQALFINNILSHYPEFPLKKGILLVKSHPQEKAERLWEILTGKNIKQLPSTINFDEEYGKLKRTYQYHQGRPVPQLKEGNETQILERALNRIRWSWNKEGNTRPITEAWEEITGKSFSFYKLSKKEIGSIDGHLSYVMSYHVGRGSQPFVDFKDFEKKEIVRVARNLYLRGEQTRHKDKPDTYELNNAIALFKKYPL